jgi:hypothetical protein
MNTKKIFKSLSYSLLCGALLTAGRHAAVAAEHQHPDMGRENSVLVSITASVESINATNRELTLKGPLGNTATFTVDPSVKRFDEIKVGDFVTAEYYMAVAGELRKPTADEEKHPIVVLEGAAKAPPGTAPAAGGLRRIRVVATIEGLDRPTQTATLRGPQGNYVTVRVADPSRLTQAHIGDKVVVTYTEALAISLEKATPHSAQ